MPEAANIELIVEDSWYDWTDDAEDCWLDQYIEAREVAEEDERFCESCDSLLFFEEARICLACAQEEEADSLLSQGLGPDGEYPEEFNPIF